MAAHSYIAMRDMGNETRVADYTTVTYVTSGELAALAAPKLFSIAGIELRIAVSALMPIYFRPMERKK